MLLDAAYLQEEQARYANKRGFSKHNPALPLYTQEDAQNAIALLTPVDYEQEVSLGDGFKARLSPSGHRLGSAFVRIPNNKTSILFSGDIGRPNVILMKAPIPIKQADYLVLESTYGNRLHDSTAPKIKLAENIKC